LKTLISSFVHPDYGHRCFKLVCDDLSLANVIARSKDELTIVGLIGLEWSYMGPAQLLGCAPWWLLGIRLNNVDTFYDKDYQETAARFSKYLGILKRIPGEEAKLLSGSKGNELLKLVE
jgi:hypothetical protein